MSNYVDPAIIQGFRDKDGPFEYTKLVSQLEGLNKNSEDIYTAAPLLRAIVDTTPPLLGLLTFDDVVSKYAWESSKRKNIKLLQEFRNEGDSSLHTLISNKKDYIGNLPPNHCVNTLLEECLKHGESKDLQNSQNLKLEKNKPKPQISISLNESTTNWQNYSVGRFMFYSFRVHLKIDNYNGTKPDYISVFMRGNTESETWQSNYFVFDDPQNTQMNANEELRIEATDVRNIKVFLSDMEPRSMPHATRFRPIAGTNTYHLIVKTKSGYEFQFEVNMVS